MDLNIENLPDYLTIPSHNFPSFHNRIGQHAAATSRPANSCGYPVPGTQSPSTVSVMAQDYFVRFDAHSYSVTCSESNMFLIISDATWANILDHGRFDYIVIGSGCTALAFIDEALKLDKNKRILCLERGGTLNSECPSKWCPILFIADFWLPSHFQNLPLPFNMVLGGPSETFPWTLSRKTFHTKELGFCHGSCPFFGGRSTFWSAWCPQPPVDLMRAFPESMTGTTETPEFWPTAKQLLHVTRAEKIDDPIFAGLQKAIDAVLKKDLKKIPSAQSVESAPLAVGRESPKSTLHFHKFSVPGPLLGLCEKQRGLALEEKGAPLELMVNCAVTGMEKGDDGFVRIVETSKGVLSWVDENTKIILCAGVTLPRIVPNIDLAVLTQSPDNSQCYTPSEFLRRVP
jgi:hypothetical protein